MWECECWRLYETTNNVKQHIQENFLYRRSLTEHQLLEEIEKKTFLAMSKATLQHLKNESQFF